MGLTTTPKSDWREKVREIEKFRIKEIALFPTMLEMKGRKKLYGLLERTNLKEIPHVHLRDDSESWELDYLYKKYKTRLFNIHYRDSDIRFLKKNFRYAENIFVENLDKMDKNFTQVLEICGGICFDASHCEDIAMRGESKETQKLLGLCDVYKVGCCHISGILEKGHWTNSMRTGKRIKIFSSHYLYSLGELDYVKKYTGYLPRIISIELGNSFEEQIEAKKYLEKIIQ